MEQRPTYRADVALDITLGAEMKVRQVFAGFAACIATTACTAQTTPSAWRALKATDPPISDERVSLQMTKVEADFNGDGKPDQAVVLLHKEDTNRAGVFVFSNGATKASSIKKLGEYQFSEGEFMLSAVNKGCYRSEKRTVCLRYSGVLRTEIEYGWGTLYWQEGGKWREVQFARGEFAGL